MSSDLQLDPAVLRVAAAVLDGLLPALPAAALDPADVAALARVPGGAALLAEHDRLATAVGHVRRELTDLVAAFTAVAHETERAERHAVRSVTVVDR